MKKNRIFLFEAIIGFLIMVSPWALNFWAINIAAVSNFVFGGIIFVVNLWIIFSKEDKIIFEPNKRLSETKVENNLNK